jgi:hypothetical protein
MQKDVFKKWHNSPKCFPRLIQLQNVLRRRKKCKTILALVSVLVGKVVFAGLARTGSVPADDSAYALNHTAFPERRNLSRVIGACTHLGLPYESHRLQAPDRKGSRSEVQQ